MMVTFVSQCEKKALPRTRRVLDAFANRIGDNTWQTVITKEGLDAVKKLLRKTASKSTAVSCHWIRSRSRSDLLWVVGNKKQFGFGGVVPVNRTERELDNFIDSGQWSKVDVIQYAAAIAGLFHDFGKANSLFQKKINPNIESESFEPYRHEWISMRLFQAFVGNKSDKQWLEALSEQDFSDLEKCFKDGIDKGFGGHPILNMPDFAQLVSWIIVSHHRLPLAPAWQDNVISPDLSRVDIWLEKGFEANWNSYHCKDKDQQSRVQENWKFEDGALPYQSIKWCSHASNIASAALVHLAKHSLSEYDYINDQVFTSHLARLSMMLADRYYSSQPEITPAWRSLNYKIYANTYDKASGKSGFKQQLDEHLIGVALNSQAIVNALPRLKNSLPELEGVESLTESIKKADKVNYKKYSWQNKAKKLAEKIGRDSAQHGFFGVNMASTGKGKTIANAKIMYALGEQTGKVRFSVALGLRTLTLQTGQEFSKSIGLNDEQLAVAVGGSAVKQLFENTQTQTEMSRAIGCGSESADERLNDDLYAHYRGKVSHSLSKWTEHDDNIDRLLSAPVLVCTIDHLISATEGTRGGRQTGAMLRLLSADLVLDEPDDFGLSDLPALCRLVNWAGMLGSRVLLSTATMPPALAFALYEAYRSGWKQYAKANITDWDGNICCAWFDEFESADYEHRFISDLTNFKARHNKFVKNRVSNLTIENNNDNKRLGKIIRHDRYANISPEKLMAETIRQQIAELHRAHQVSRGKKSISIGLVRMANINPLVSVAQNLMQFDAPNIDEVNDCCIHYCVYHSRYPLAVRNFIENKLDTTLKRKDGNKIFSSDNSVGRLIDKHPQKHHIFVVLASPVSEVGRDHDYDWAVVEPSSMRSIIQLAGRVLRHREKAVTSPNIVLLDQNFKALKNKKVCFSRPGFEMDDLLFRTHYLSDLLTVNQHKVVNAVPRITLPDKDDYTPDKDGFYINLNGLEHKALAWQLFSGARKAKIWWNDESSHKPYWCGEAQRQQRFRDSQQDEAYYLWFDDGNTTPYWLWLNENVRPSKLGEVSGISISTDIGFSKGKNIHFWFDQSPEYIYQSLADELNMELTEVSRRFGELRITTFENSNNREYFYHNNLGMYQEMDGNESRR